MHYTLSSDIQSETMCSLWMASFSIAMICFFFFFFESVAVVRGLETPVNLG